MSLSSPPKRYTVGLPYKMNPSLSPIKSHFKFKETIGQMDFTLDCTSARSKMTEYNSLTDRQMKYYFQNPHIKGNLFKSGVIDARGKSLDDRKIEKMDREYQQEIKTYIKAQEKLSPFKDERKVITYVPLSFSQDPIKIQRSVESINAYLGSKKGTKVMNEYKSGNLTLPKLKETLKQTMTNGDLKEMVNKYQVNARKAALSLTAR